MLCPSVQAFGYSFVQTLTESRILLRKKFSEAVWLLRTFSKVYILKIIISTPFEKFIEAFRLITKIFLGVDSEKSLKYTFEKIL